MMRLKARNELYNQKLDKITISFMRKTENDQMQRTKQ